MPAVILWGATGQAKVVRPILECAGFNVTRVFDNARVPSPFPDVPMGGGRRSCSGVRPTLSARKRCFHYQRRSAFCHDHQWAQSDSDQRCRPDCEWLELYPQRRAGHAWNHERLGSIGQYRGQRPSLHNERARGSRAMAGARPSPTGRHRFFQH
jgi:hypothetical protein